MRRIITILVIGIAALFSSTAQAQSVSQSWVQSLYIGATQALFMAKDNSGNIYLSSTNSGGFYTWKYNASGVLQWTATYNCPGSSGDAVYAMTVDASSNVIVTGISYFNSYYTASTIKYNTSGVRLWAVQTSIESYFTAANAMTTDAAGNIYLTGYTMVSGINTQDYGTWKLDANGVLQWSAIYNGSANRNDMAHAIALDASGNVYVTGQSEGSITVKGFPTKTIATGDDYVTIKYDPAGNALWTSRYYSAQANYADIATGLVLDASGNVYVTGSANNVGTTVAYNSAGSRLWVGQGASQNNTAIAKDASGNIIVAGYNTAGYGTPYTYYITKYTAAGVVSWTQTYQSGTNYDYGDRIAPRLAVDAQSNVYMAGAVLAAGATYYTGYNFVTIKLSSSSGAFVWIVSYNGPTNNLDVPSALVLYQKSSVVGTNYPSVYVAGATDYSGGNSYSTVVKYTQSVTGGASVTVVGASQPYALNGSDGGLILSNWPNPYKGTTNISYTLPFESHVGLQVYDMAGKLVAVPVNKKEPAGSHTVPFHASAAGVYSYRIVATSELGTFTATKQMVVQ